MTKPNDAFALIDAYCNSCKYRRPPYSRDEGHCYMFRGAHEGLMLNAPYCAQRVLAEREKGGE